MPAVFTTADDQPNAIEITGVGSLAAFGERTITLEHAASIMPELQDNEYKPLTGAQLTAAAKRFAKERGFQVANVDESKVPVLVQSAYDVSRAEAARDFPIEQPLPTDDHVKSPVTSKDKAEFKSTDSKFKS